MVARSLVSPCQLADTISPSSRSFQRSYFVSFVMTASRRAKETERERRVYIYVYTRIYSDKSRSENARKAGRMELTVRNRRNAPTRRHTWTTRRESKNKPCTETDGFSRTLADDERWRWPGCSINPCDFSPPTAACGSNTHMTRRETIDDIILTGPAARRDVRER